MGSLQGSQRPLGVRGPPFEKHWYKVSLIKSHFSNNQPLRYTKWVLLVSHFLSMFKAFPSLQIQWVAKWGSILIYVIVTFLSFLWSVLSELFCSTKAIRREVKDCTQNYHHAHPDSLNVNTTQVRSNTYNLLSTSVAQVIEVA